MVAVNIVAVAAASAVTYAITKNNASSATTPPSASSAAPTFTAAEQDAAKNKVCATFAMSQRGVAGQGGLIDKGQINVPVVLRTLNSVVALQNVSSPAIPEELRAAVNNYVSTTVDLTTASLANAPIDELTRLNDVGNTALYGLADVCGLPH
ncbi:hypothetical protein MycrhDRAFT_6958 [Mycolicibacterium rhodesiae JS60]|nr:hypothetical protein MycrhDRAFT_6958 [Mycolicibacterium rhodesiae JS60]